MSPPAKLTSSSPTPTSRRRHASISSASTSLPRRGQAAPYGPTRRSPSSTALISTAIRMPSRPTRCRGCRSRFSAPRRFFRPRRTNATSASPIQRCRSSARPASPPSSRTRSRRRTGGSARLSPGRRRSPQDFSMRTKATSRNARPSISARAQARRRMRGETSPSPGCRRFSQYSRSCCTSASPAPGRQSLSRRSRPSRS